MSYPDSLSSFKRRAAGYALAVPAVLLVCGCTTAGRSALELRPEVSLGPTTSAPAEQVGWVNVQREIAAVTAEVVETRQSLGDIHARVSQVNQSTANYDRWALRIQAAGPYLLLLLPLCYLSGKLVWVLGATLRRRHSGCRPLCR